MLWHAFAIGASLLACAGGLQTQNPPQSRIATFNGASLHIRGVPGRPVILQGYNDARQMNNFSWTDFKDKLALLKDPMQRRSQSDALVAAMIQDDEAAAILMNMMYAHKHGYSYSLYSYKHTHQVGR